MQLCSRTEPDSWLLDTKVNMQGQHTVVMEDSRGNSFCGPKRRDNLQPWCCRKGTGNCFWPSHKVLGKSWQPGQRYAWGRCQCQARGLAGLSQVQRWGAGQQGDTMHHGRDASKKLWWHLSTLYNSKHEDHQKWTPPLSPGASGHTLYQETGCPKSPTDARHFALQI